MEGAAFGRYRLLELLGRGGMGEVWRAHDTVIRRDVAIKVLHPNFAEDPAFENRFRREAHAAAQLNNPHVVPIHNVGEIDGRLFVDMRLIEGRDLTSVIADGPMDPARAVRVIAQIGSALDAAHQIGLVHGDVKPSNIMLAADDYAYLIDFGIAHAITDTRLTGTGNAIGTFAYMAPERFTSAPLDPRCDIYALACVLYECLTGEPPFRVQEPGRLIAAHMSEPPPRPSDARPELPRALDAVVARGMAKEPADRYGTGRELAAAATAALAAPPPPPRPPPTRPSVPPPEEAPPTRLAATMPVPLPPPDDRDDRAPVAAPVSQQRRGVKPAVLAAVGAGVLALIAVVVLVMSMLPGDTVDPTTDSTTTTPPPTTTTTTAVTTTTTTTTSERVGTVYKDCNGQRIPESQPCPEPPKCPEGSTAQNGACLCPNGTTVDPGAQCPKPLDCPDGSSEAGGECVCDSDGSTVESGGTCPPPEPCPPEATESGGQCVCPDGQTAPRGGSCPITEECPEGQTGTPPDCVEVIPEVCPEGTVGTPPKCIPVSGESGPQSARSTVPRDFLRELGSSGDTEFGEDVGQVGLHGTG